MARKKKLLTIDEHPVITPVRIEQITVVTQQEMEVPPGYVLLVALNEDGTEKNASEFFYPEKNYLKYYGDETKFKLKTKNELTDNPPYYENLYRASQVGIRLLH